MRCRAKMYFQAKEVYFYERAESGELQEREEN